MRQAVEIIAVHVGIEPVEMNIRLDRRFGVPTAAMVAAVGEPAILRVIKAAVSTQHQARTGLVHLLVEANHALPLRTGVPEGLRGHVLQVGPVDPVADDQPCHARLLLQRL